jgi:hypothetical protein
MALASYFFKCTFTTFFKCDYTIRRLGDYTMKDDSPTDDVRVNRTKVRKVSQDLLELCNTLNFNGANFQTLLAGKKTLDFLRCIT